MGMGTKSQITTQLKTNRKCVLGLQRDLKNVYKSMNSTIKLFIRLKHVFSTCSIVSDAR